MSAADDRDRVNAAVAGALGKHLAAHKVARGQDFWQSGTECFWSGQQGMPSGMDAIPTISVIGSAVAIAAADGVIVGAVKRLAIARIERRRRNKDQGFTAATWHIVRRKKRWRRSRCRQRMAIQQCTRPTQGGRLDRDTVLLVTA